MYYDERGNYFDYLNQENTDFTDITEVNNEDYDINIKDKDYNIDVNNINVYNFRPASKVEVANPVEGFNRGNMFNNLYEPYKNHYYRVMVKGERDSLLLNIQILSFALTDLNLYLDLYPNDKECIDLFNKYNEELRNYKAAFEKKYGPITVDAIKYQNDFIWINNPWPWDKGGNA